MLKFFLIIFLFSFTYRLLYFGFYWFKAIKYYKIYENWVRESDSVNIYLLSKPIKDVFKAAKVSNKIVPTVKPLGLGRIASANVSVFDNIGNRREEIVAGILNSFDEAIGSLKFEFFNTLNPLWWITSILLLPKNLLTYLNFNENNILYRILNIFLSFFWWLFLAILSFLGIENMSFQQLLDKLQLFV